MASTVIPHFTRGGELITKFNVSINENASAKAYTATEDCRVVIYTQQFSQISINAMASANAYNFDNGNGNYLSVNSNALNETVCGRNISSIGSMVSIELNKGDYISVHNRGYSTLTIQFYVYTV